MPAEVNLPEHIYKIIESEGNTVISAKLIRRYGIEKIVNKIYRVTKKTVTIRKCGEEGNYFYVAETVYKRKYVSHKCV